MKSSNNLSVQLVHIPALMHHVVFFAECDAQVFTKKYLLLPGELPTSNWVFHCLNFIYKNADLTSRNVNVCQTSAFSQCICRKHLTVVKWRKDLHKDKRLAKENRQVEFKFKIVFASSAVGLSWKLWLDISLKIGSWGKKIHYMNLWNKNPEDQSGKKTSHWKQWDHQFNDLLKPFGHYTQNE